MRVDRWKSEDKRSVENKLLWQYAKKMGGLVFSEVPVGQSSKEMWPIGSKVRFLDGLRICGSSESDEIIRYRSRLHEEMSELVEGGKVEVIEVKQKLNRPVIGQALAGVDMTLLEYGPREATPVVLFLVGDPALEIVCERRGVRLWTPPPRDVI